MEEILEIYENRWSIELSHREANQKFGFKDYQMRDKGAIERFMRLSFLAWTIVLIAKATGKDFRTVIREMKLGEILDETKLLYLVEMLNLPPTHLRVRQHQRGTREEARRPLLEVRRGLLPGPTAPATEQGN